MKLKIDPSERWIIVGKTGSGKTIFAKHLLRHIAGKMPVVIVDPKEYWLGSRPEWASGKELGTVDKPRLINSFNPKWHVQLLQPDADDKEDDRLAKLCREVLKRGNTFIYFDESEDIATAYNVPYYIRRIWKTGRAKGVGAWVSTQAPTGIPKIFKSQAEHFISFKVGVEDADIVANLVHCTEQQIRGLKPFEWLYYNVQMDNGVLNAPIPLKEQKHARNG